MKPILFTEREPDENQSIIVWDDKVKRWCGIFCYTGVVPRYCTMLGVTYWLPMPPAPESEPVGGEELTYQEQESDREQADKMLAALGEV